MIQKNEVEKELDKAGILYQSLYFSRNGSTAENSQQVYDDQGLIYKTLVLKGNKTGIVIALLPLCNRLDYQALARTIGDRKIGLPPIEYVIEKTGYVHGANTPLGIKLHHPEYLIVADQDITKKKEIIVSSGEVGKGLKLKTSDLLKLIEPVLADIKKTIDRD